MKEIDQLNKKFSAIVTIIVMIFMFFTLPKLQAQKKRVIKLANRLDVFVNVGDINSITPLIENDKAGLIRAIQFQLAKKGIKTLSSRTAKQRILDINRNPSGGISIDGPTTIIKSDLVLELSYRYTPFGIYNVAGSIIDLKQNGEVVGGIDWGAGLQMERGVDTVAEAVVYRLIQELK